MWQSLLPAEGTVSAQPERTADWGQKTQNKSLADGWTQIPVNHHFQLKDQKIFKAEEEQIERERKEVPFIVIICGIPRVP